MRVIMQRGITAPRWYFELFHRGLGFKLLACEGRQYFGSQIEIEVGKNGYGVSKMRQERKKRGRGSSP